MVFFSLVAVSTTTWAGGGTVTLGSLVWLEDAGCMNGLSYSSVQSKVASLKVGQCGLNDGSKAGDWRLPSISELEGIDSYQSKFKNIGSDPYYSNIVDSATGYIVYYFNWHTRGANSFTGKYNALAVRKK